MILEPMSVRLSVASSASAPMTLNISSARWHRSSDENLKSSSGFESLILPHHSSFNVTCECNKEEINDDDDDGKPEELGI